MIYEIKTQISQEYDSHVEFMVLYKSVINKYDIISIVV